MRTLVAVIPPIYLLYLIYKMDKIEKEPVGLVFKVFLLGALSTLPAGLIEAFLSSGLSGFLPQESILFRFIMYFFIVAWTEEGVKHFALKHGSYNNPAFNYRFDAIIYSTAAALGFAAAENIGYVDIYGYNVAFGRALTAIPAHCIFGIFMGIFYGIAKDLDMERLPKDARMAQRTSLLIPIILHGTYDFLASSNSDASNILFLAFIIAMDIIALIFIRKMARKDERIY